MSDDILPLNLGSGGRNEDVESLTGAGGANVIRQRLQVAGVSLAEIARVLNVSPTGNEYGLVTRNIPSLNQVGAFGRFRISTPQTLFDSKQIVDNQPLFWDDQQTSGAGTSSTYNANQASTTLAVGATTAGTRVRQTFRRFNYQPGKALRHGEPVLTPNGWKNIEDICVGDIVFDGLGYSTQVISVHPQGLRQIYRSFSFRNMTHTF